MSNHICPSCGRSLSEDSLAQFGDRWICVECKPMYLQRLREGCLGDSSTKGKILPLSVKRIFMLSLLVGTSAFLFFCFSISSYERALHAKHDLQRMHIQGCATVAVIFALLTFSVLIIWKAIYPLWSKHSTRYENGANPDLPKNGPDSESDCSSVE